VVVGLDDAVGGAALAGHVAVERIMLVVWLCCVTCRFSPALKSCVRWLATISNSALYIFFFLCALVFQLALSFGSRNCCEVDGPSGDRTLYMGIGVTGLEAMARTDRRSLPCRSPFWRIWW
jgi:hypothetical protein